MNYMNGTAVKLGDLVRLNDDEIATVVAIIEDEQFLPGVSAGEWRYLKRGVLIDSTKYGLFHYEDIDDDVVFIDRGTIGSAS